MPMNHEQAYVAFKDKLLNPQVGSELVDVILDEKASETINVVSVKEGLSIVRDYFSQLKLPDFIITKTKLHDGKYITITMYQANVVAPIVLSMILDFDASVTAGDMGECQIHVQMQPYVLEDGSLVNDKTKFNKQFNKDEQCRLSPIFWVNQAMNVRRDLYRLVYHNDVLAPTDSFEKILSPVRRFLDIVRLGQAPIFMQAIPKDPQFLLNNPCSSFLLSVVMRGKMLFTIRF